MLYHKHILLFYIITICSISKAIDFGAIKDNVLGLLI